MLFTLGMLVWNLHFYPRAMVIDEIVPKEDKAICIDAVDYKWDFKGPEDLEKGDLVICTMYDNGTPDYIFDDEIVDVTWSGYWIEGNEIFSAGQ